jgi:hypothetical protein
VSTTQTITFTNTKWSFTQSISYTTKTETATCTVPSKKRDKPCTYSPTKIHPAALVTPTIIPRVARYAVRDRAVDVEYARKRIAAAKLKRDLAMRDAGIILGKRAPDAPTLTITAATPANTTSTITAAPITATLTTAVTTTSSTTLPPVTVYSGIFTATITAPTPTRTKLTFALTTVTSTKSIVAT